MKRRFEDLSSSLDVTCNRKSVAHKLDTGMYINKKKHYINRA